jgi:UbiD family decarboxylase
MAYRDLQEYLAKLDAAGKLHRIKEQVDPAWEVAAITREVFDRYSWDERPALCFEKVGDCSFPLVVGAVGGSPSIYALALSTPVAGIPSLWERAQREPVAPVPVDTGPCKEVIARGDEVDVRNFPHCIWTPGLDPGPYITAGLVITKDPETGERNVGVYRLQIKGARRLGLYIGPAQDGARHVRKHEQKKLDVPVAIAIGADPAVVLTAATKFSYTTDEFKIAGGLRGKPVPVVKCETIDLEVPAHSEIVLEGTVPCGVREEEGPFGEYTGYMGPGGSSLVVELRCITRKKTPVYQAFLSQMPPSESSCIRSLGRSAAMLRHLRDVLGYPVTDVHFAESGGSATRLIIAVRKDFPEQVKAITWAAWGLMQKEGKFTIVVDDDIDIRNSSEVEWALGFRVQPARDIWVVNETLAAGLDPSLASADVPQHDPSRKTGSKVMIDATRKHAYPAAARVPKEHLEAVAKKWRQYGFK